MAFQIKGLDPKPFQEFYGKSEEELKAHGVIRYQVDECPGYPDRVTLSEVEAGGTVLLMNFEHLPVDSPYRSRHAIFVQEGAQEADLVIDKVPDSLARRVLSLRAFDKNDHIVEADLAEGEAIEPTIRRLLENSDVQYIHAHYAQRGCYAALIERSE